jgi:Phosphohistidine phosphatase SixA
MRLLTLLRHAKSSWDHPHQRDFDRPLNPRGLRNAPMMAMRMASVLERPLLLVSSPAQRAMQTAEAFAAALALDDGARAVEPSIYEASPGDLLALVNAFDDDHGHVLMVGHNPGLSELAHLLAPDCAFLELRTCGLVSLRLDAARWTAVVPGCGRVLRHHDPKDPSGDDAGTPP